MLKKYILHFAGIIIVFTMLFCCNATSAPINPATKDVMQPNGKIITISSYGDEFFCWDEDENGNIVAYDTETKSYKYATIEDGKIVPTSQTVGGISLFSIFSQKITREDILPLWENADRVDYSKNYDGIQLMAADNGIANEQAPLTNQKLLTVLIEFNDIKMKYSADFWSEQMYSIEPDALSVVNYWKENSNGLDIFEPADTSGANIGGKGTVSYDDYIDIDYEITERSDGVVKVSLDMPHPSKTKRDNNNGAHSTVNLTVRALENNFDFTAQKPHIVTIFAGYGDYVPLGSEEKGHVRAYASAAGIETSDGIQLGRYTAQGEKQFDNVPEGIGVTCHELGHSVFYLPDLYFSNSPSELDNGLNDYSLMAYGCNNCRRYDASNPYRNDYKDPYANQPGHVPAHLDAWCKIKCGFVKPVIVSEWDGCINSISEMGENSQYNVIEVRSKADPMQYFLIENRQLIGFDKGLECLDESENERTFNGGIIIYHIDENVLLTNNNNSTWHQYISIERSGHGHYKIDPYPVFWTYLNVDGRDTLNSETVPNSNFHETNTLKECSAIEDCHPQSVKSGISIGVLGESSPSMRVKVNVDDEYRIEITGETFSDIFPDINFCKAVIEMLEEDGIERNADDIISIDDWFKIMSVYELQIDGRGIKNLSGFEHFMKLEELDCSNNEITQLDISNNTQLMYLNCSNNKLTELNISDCQNLLWLYCENNLLKNLDISCNKELNWLYCSGNQLKKLDISNNSDLARLLCYDNYMDENPENSIIGLENNIKKLGEAGTKDNKKKFTYYPQYTTFTQTPGPTAIPTARPTVTTTATPTPTDIPNYTPTPTITPSVPPIVEQNNRIEFTELDDNIVLAVLTFEKSEITNIDNLLLFVSYRSKNGELLRVEMPKLIGTYTLFEIPNELLDCDIDVYVWNNNLAPLMEAQKLVKLQKRE